MRELPARFLLAGIAPLDQPGDDGAGAECALHQRRFGEPGLQIVAQHVLVEQRGERQLAARDVQGDIAEAPDGERIFIGDEAERLQARRAPAGASAACPASGAPAVPRTDSRPGNIWRRAGRSRPADRRRAATASAIAGSPAIRAPASGSARQCAAVGEDRAHAGGEIGRERELAALVGRHLRIGGGRARDIGLVLDQRLVFQDFAGEDEGVARRQRLDEIFLDLAEQPPAARNRLRRWHASAPAAP